MSEFSEAPSDQTILHEALQEQITFSAENCFSIHPVGTIPPETTAMLDAYSTINKQEKFYSQFAVEMPPTWKFIVEECGQDIINKAAEMGVTIKDIEKFYPHFILKDKYKEVNANRHCNGFADPLSRRPVVFVDKPTSELTLKDIGVIYHEMIHALSRRTIFVRYDESGEHYIDANLGVGGIWNQNIEESIAHREATNYLNDEGMFAKMRQTQLERLKIQTGKEVYPGLNEIRYRDKNGTSVFLDTAWVNSIGLGNITFTLSNDADHFVQTVLDFLPETERKNVEMLFRKSRFAANYKYANLARRIIQKYWGEVPYHTIIETTDFSRENISKSINKLEDIKKIKQPVTMKPEEIPEKLSDLIK